MRVDRVESGGDAAGQAGRRAALVVGGFAGTLLAGLHGGPP